MVVSASPGKLDLRRCLSKISFLTGVGLFEIAVASSIFSLNGLFAAGFWTTMGFEGSFGFVTFASIAAVSEGTILGVFRRKTNPQSSSKSDFGGRGAL